MPLTDWENFYVIVGSSAGALIGLQFVVITLIADMPVGPGVQRAGEAFMSPTIIHFGVVLLLAGMLSAPWHGLNGVEIFWGLLGLCGIIYTFVVARRMRAARVAYQPVLEDHLCHFVLPLVAYVGLAFCSFFARSHVHDALFGVAGAALLLLFVGIHNAWDAVTYNVFVMRHQQQERERR